jgi:hypothetical protein
MSNIFCCTNCAKPCLKEFYDKETGCGTYQGNPGENFCLWECACDWHSRHPGTLIFEED